MDETLKASKKERKLQEIAMRAAQQEAKKISELAALRKIESLSRLQICLSQILFCRISKDGIPEEQR